jgi:mitotic spindle assembly checkpoint protein MAD2B
MFLESHLGISLHPCPAQYLLYTTAYFLAYVRVGKLARLVMMDTNQEFHAVLDTFTKFLIVAIHQILHNRNIYPPTTFITAKMYNLPVHQNRHSGLCEYINDATTAVHRAILSGTVKRISVVIFVQNLPREKFVFDISRLSQRILDTAGREIELEESFPLVDAEEQLRAALSKLRDHCVSLDALDAQGTFSMALENDKDSALGSDDGQQWVNVPQTGTAEDRCRGEHSSNNVRIWSVEAGALAFEVWYGLFWTASRPSSDIPSQTQASHGSTTSSSHIYGTFPSSQMDSVI